MPLDALSVACNHCGASLPVAESTRFVTCTYCGTQLEIHRTGQSAYTEVLQSTDERTQRIEQDLAAIKRQNELEQLDREWAERQKQFMIAGKDGQSYRPSPAGAVVGAMIAVVFGIGWICLTASMGAPFFFPLFGLLFVGAGVYSAISGLTQSSAYADAERAYQSQRQRLLGSPQDNSPIDPHL